MTDSSYSELIYVAIVEDDPDINKALQLLVDGTEGLRCVGAFQTAEKALDKLPELQPDVLLLDHQLPGQTGITAIPSFLNAMPEISILMLTIHEEESIIFKALAVGAKGYLLKTTAPNKLLKAIQEIYQGGSPLTGSVARKVLGSFIKTTNNDYSLTRREVDILQRLCAGDSYKMIAQNLHISTGTVHCHIKNLYRKLDVHSSSEAVVMALRENLV